MKYRFTEKMLLDHFTGTNIYGQFLSDIGKNTVAWVYGDRDGSGGYTNINEYSAEYCVCWPDWGRSGFYPAWPPDPRRADFIAKHAVYPDC